jgi:hypothetical protein
MRPKGNDTIWKIKSSEMCVNFIKKATYLVTTCDNFSLFPEISMSHVNV